MASTMTIFAFFPLGDSPSVDSTVKLGAVGGNGFKISLERLYLDKDTSRLLLVILDLWNRSSQPLS